MNPTHRPFWRRVRLRIRTSWLAATAQLVAPVAAATSVVAIAASRLTADPRYLRLGAALLATAVVILVLRAATFRLSHWDVVRAAERGLDAGDTLTSSLEFTDDTDPFHLQIQQRADSILATARADRAIPMRLDRIRLSRAGLIAGFALLAALLPAITADPALSADESSLLTEEAVQLEEIADAIEAQVADSDRIADELRTLADSLRKSGSLDEGLRELDASSRRLQADADPKALTQRAAVQGLARDLALRPLTAGHADAAAQLEALAAELAGLSAPEQAAIADRLGELAEAQAAGNPGLSSSLATAGQGIRSGGTAAASAALGEAAASYRNALGAARGQQALDEALRAIAGASSRLGSGQGTGAASSAGGAGNGEGGGDGSGPGSGGGQGGGSGSGGQGAGSPSGIISGVRGGDGTAAAIGGAGSVGAGGELGEERSVRTDTVFEPADVGGVSELLQVGLDGGQGDGPILGTADAPTELGEALVPFTQVLPTYLTDAADALERLELSPSMRSIVRTYFDLLAEQAR